MSILISGMEMPKEGSWATVRIYPDGTCAVPNWQGDCTLIKGAKTVPVPPHGDLIDRQKAINVLWKALFEYEDRTEKQFVESSELDVDDWILHRIFVQNMSDIDRQTILQMPTIIPASEEE